MMRALKPEELQLKGSWVVKNGSVEKDEVTKRIEWLVLTSLRRIATDATGWDTLYQDVGDGRLWELIYQESEIHGGGPPLLRSLPREDAAMKYKLA